MAAGIPVLALAVALAVIVSKLVAGASIGAGGYQGQAFTQGNLLVLRMGCGTANGCVAAPTSGGNGAFTYLDEYSPSTGLLVSSLPINTTTVTNTSGSAVVINVCAGATKTQVRGEAACAAISSKCIVSSRLRPTGSPIIPSHTTAPYTRIPPPTHIAESLVDQQRWLFGDPRPVRAVHPNCRRC